MKINVTINGPIGSGKTTLMNALTASLRESGISVIVQPEPSVTIPFINAVLEKFYRDSKNWAYPLQLAISAAQESFMQDLLVNDYDAAITDAAWSSSIYGYSHAKAGRITQNEFHTLESINRDFVFTDLIWLQPSLEAIKKNVAKRNSEILKNTSHANQKDVDIDLSYLDGHYRDFLEYKPIYFNKFKAYNNSINIMEITDIPDIRTPEYQELVNSIKENILRNYERR